METIVKELTEAFDAKLAEVKNSLDTSEKIGEFEASITELQSASKTIRTAQAQMVTKLTEIAEAKEKSALANNSDIMRVPLKNGAKSTELTPMELVFAASAADYNQSRDLKRILMDGIDASDNEMTVERAEQHMAGLAAADKFSALPSDHPRRQFNESMRAQALTEVKNAIASSDTNGATHAIAAAEMYPLIAASATVFPLIPIEPRMSESGRVRSASPFSNATIAVISQNADITDSSPTSSVVELDAVEVGARVNVSDAFVEDFAFVGDAIREAIDPTMRRMGVVLDDAIIYGDETASNNLNNLTSASSTAVQRHFTGLARPTLRATNDNLRVDAGGDALTITDLANAYGLMGTDFGSPMSDIVVVLPLKSEADLLKDSNLTAINTIAPDGSIRIGYVTGLGQMTFVTHDSILGTNGLRTPGANNSAAGAVSGTADDNTARVGLMFNRRTAKIGFTRNFNIRVTPAPAGTYSVVIPNFRVAFKMVDGTANRGQVTIRNII